jgi:hypothetical protein
MGCNPLGEPLCHVGPDSSANAEWNKDVVVPINAVLLAEHLPNAQLIMYPDASHGAQSQHADIFFKARSVISGQMSVPQVRALTSQPII